MDALQREIVDERKERLISFPRQSDVGSMGSLGLCAGLTTSWQSFGSIDRVLPAESWQSFGSTDREHVTDLWKCLVSVDRELLAERLIVSAGQAPVETSPHVSRFRQRELEWRRTHAAALKQFENQWVVLEGEEILAHGLDPVEVINEAKSKGVRTPYVFFVEPRTENVVTIGL